MFPKTKNKPTLNKLFPMFNNMQDVEGYLDSCLPINNKNELMAVLQIYKNTLFNFYIEEIK